MRRTIALIAAAAALAASAAPAMAARPATATGTAALTEARTLAVHWGRCPTSIPAHRALRAAELAPAPKRAARAAVARRAWKAVVAQCSVPTPTVTVVVAG
ncbi:MAG: hypothetical protein KDC33_00705 [Thermoleophilia bacterium]|nr:hypothetical protein [Thermoleophilia bacterium]